MMYSIGQFAKKTGVTIRTLHYYDEIGLLSPAHLSDSGQRFYNDDSIKTIQTILVCKYLDYSLEEIRAVLLDKEKTLLDSLYEQKVQLEAKRKQIDQMIASLETAIDIHEKYETVDPSSLLIVIHSLLTMDEQKKFLQQYLSEDLIDQMYTYFDNNFALLNRKYIEYSHQIKKAFITPIHDEALKELIVNYLQLIPRDLALQVTAQMQNLDVKDIDYWLFTPLFSEEEEHWLTEQMERLNLYEVFENE